MKPPEIACVRLAERYAGTIRRQCHENLARPPKDSSDRARCGISFWPCFPALLLALNLLLLGTACKRAGEDGTVPNDEAKQAGLSAQDFRYPITDKQNFFRGMDVVATPRARPDQLLDRDDLKAGDQPGPRPLADIVHSKNEILGRNTWMIWCAGNEQFWDWLAGHSYGFTDLLKLVDSRTRPNRFKNAGLINEPGMREAAKPDENGLWIDVPTVDEARPPTPPVNIYGKSSGVIGLRLFPNPKFDQAKAKWDPKRYYEDPSYFNDPNLQRPYRVGMSCAFCHASFHPLNPPTNVAEPRWENISGNIGAQYLRIRAVFGNLLQKDNFVYHLLDAQPPGTTDTSLIPSDNLNNPNAMNAIFQLPQRVVRSFVNPPEELRGDSLTQPTVWAHPTEALEPLPEGEDAGFVWQANPQTGKLDYRGYGVDKVPSGLWEAFDKTGLLERVKHSNNSQDDFDKHRYVPRVLFDGADSIGAWGALARVFLNIGCFGNQWVRLHSPLIGFTPQKAFRLADLVEHSTSWAATQERVAPLRDYFLKITPPMPLLAAKGADAKTEPIDVVKTKANLKKEDIDGANTALTINAKEWERASRTERERASKDLESERAKRIDVSQLKRGRKVFANNCIVCHSSIQPENDSTLPADNELSNRRKQLFAEWAKAGEFWDHDPGRWLQDDAYKEWAEKVVETPDFWKNNFLSSDYRIPITLVGTNPARSLATNGLDGHMWSDFTSLSYKQMPSVGSIKYFNPYAGARGEEQTFMPRHQAPKGSPEGGGGVGFYRPASLVSVWTSAPLLHNNSLGLFNNDPSVDGRLIAFDDAIRKLLWPARRLESSSYNEATPERLKEDHGLIWRTTEVTYITLPGQYVPSFLVKIPAIQNVQKWYAGWAPEHPLAQRIFSIPWLPGAILFVIAYLCFVLVGRKRSTDPVVVLRRRWWARRLGYAAIFIGLIISAFLYLLSGRLGDVRLGPIPKGTPVSLLANTNPDADPIELKKAVLGSLEALADIESRHLPPDEARTLMRDKVAPALMKVSKCPDFVMDEGHYFKWFEAMSDEDKNALIELLKTF
jgi:mono/diheme cytochrome c family protein